jgi:hypothetical protein
MRHYTIARIVMIMDRLARRGWDEGFQEIAYQRLLRRRNAEITN